MNSTSWIMVACPCVINLSLWWDFTFFPTTVTDSSLALWMTPYQFSSPRVQILHIRFGWRFTVRYHSERGGRKRIFILFFCVVPPSQYPPSGFAGHLLINKEAYPIPILSVRIPFLNTAANPSLMFRMTPYRISSFWTGVRMLYENEKKSQHDTEWRIYYPDSVLPSSSLRQQILHIRSGWRFIVFFITAASLRHRSGWYLTVRRQKKLLAHAVRLRILACRNDLNRKRIVSLQLTAAS